MGPQRATLPRISNCAHTEPANMFGEHHNLNAPLSSACVRHIVVFFILTRGDKCSLRQQRWESQSASRQAARIMTAKATVMQAARYLFAPLHQSATRIVPAGDAVDAKTQSGWVGGFLLCPGLAAQRHSAKTLGQLRATMETDTCQYNNCPTECIWGPIGLRPRAFQLCPHRTCTHVW